MKPLTPCESNIGKDRLSVLNGWIESASNFFSIIRIKEKQMNKTECIVCEIHRHLLTNNCLDLESWLRTQLKNDFHPVDCLNNLSVMNMVKVLKFSLKVFEKDARKIKNDNFIKITTSSHPVIFFKAIHSILKFQKSQNEISHAVILMERALTSEFIERILLLSLGSEIDGDAIEYRSDWTDMVTLLVSVPSAVYNTGHMNQPVTTKSRNLFGASFSRKLYKVFGNLLARIFDGSVSMSHVSKMSYYMQRLVLSGHGSLAQHIFFTQSMSDMILQSSQWITIYRAVFDNLTKTVRESVIKDCVTLLETSVFLCLFPLMDKTVTHILTQTLIFNESYDHPKLASRLADIIKEDLSLSQSVFSQILKYLTSTTDAIKTISVSKTLYFAIILLKLSQRIPVETESSHLFIQSVSVFLEVLDKTKQNILKYLIQQISLLFLPLSNNKKLEFDITYDENIRNIEFLIGSKSIESAQNFSSGSSETDSDDFEEQPTPEISYSVGNSNNHYYLRDCLGGLSSREDFSKVEASLQGCARLICQSPSELCLLSVELASTILHGLLDLSLKHIVELKSKCLIDLVTFDPERVIPYLASEYQKIDLHMLQRFEIINALAMGSSKLAQLRDEPPKFSLPGRRTTEIAAADTHHPHYNNSSRPNRLYKYHKLIIYSLIRAPQDHRSYDVTKDLLVAAQMLRSLALILSLTGDPNKSGMVNNILDFLNTFRGQKDSGIIKPLLECLIATLNCITNLPDEEVVPVFKRVIETYTWIKEMASEHDDEKIMKMIEQIDKTLEH